MVRVWKTKSLLFLRRLSTVTSNTNYSHQIQIRFCNLRKWKDFNKKNSLSCVVHGPISGRFMGFYVNGFLSIPLKDSDMAWDSNYSHLGWETVSCYRCFLSPVLMSTGLSPTLSVSNFSLRPCCYLSTVTRSSSRGSVDGFRRERLQKFATFNSLSVQRRLEAR